MIKIFTMAFIGAMCIVIICDLFLGQVIKPENMLWITLPLSFTWGIMCARLGRIHRAELAEKADEPEEE